MELWCAGSVTISLLFCVTMEPDWLQSSRRLVFFFLFHFFGCRKSLLEVPQISARFPLELDKFTVVGCLIYHYGGPQTESQRNSIHCGIEAVAMIH